MEARSQIGNDDAATGTATSEICLRTNRRAQQRAHAAYLPEVYVAGESLPKARIVRQTLLFFITTAKYILRCIPASFVFFDNTFFPIVAHRVVS